MSGISRQLEKSLARGPVPRNDLLEKETQAKDEAIGKYHAEHELRLKAEHEKKIADEILVVERARFAQETRRLETSLAEERQRVGADRLRADELQARLSAFTDQRALIALLEEKINALGSAHTDHKSMIMKQNQGIERLQSIRVVPPLELKSWVFTIKRNVYDQMTEVIAEPMVKK